MSNTSPRRVNLDTCCESPIFTGPHAGTLCLRPALYRAGFEMRDGGYQLCGYHRRVFGFTDAISLRYLEAQQIARVMGKPLDIVGFALHRDPETLSTFKGDPR